MRNMKTGRLSVANCMRVIKAHTQPQLIHKLKAIHHHQYGCCCHCNLQYLFVTIDSLIYNQIIQLTFKFTLIRVKTNF